MKHLQLLPMPACCGAWVLGYFGYASTNANSTGQHNLADLDADIMDAERRAGYGLMQVIINDEQVPHIEPLLKKHGYKLVGKDLPGQMAKGDGVYGASKFNDPEDVHRNNIYIKTLKSCKKTEIAELKYHTTGVYSGKTQGTANKAAGTSSPKVSSVNSTSSIQYVATPSSAFRRFTPIGSLYSR